MYPVKNVNVCRKILTERTQCERKMLDVLSKPWSWNNSDVCVYKKERKRGMRKETECFSNGTLFLYVNKSANIMLRKLSLNYSFIPQV